MWLLQLAWKNLWRNRNRTLITTAAIFFAVLLSVLTSSLKSGIFDNLVKNMVSYYAGYIQVHQKGYWDEQLLDNSLEMSDSLSSKMRSQHGVNGVSPRLESFALVSSSELTKGCLVVGVDPEKENDITKLRSSLKRGRYITSNDNGVLISVGLLKRMKLQLHDTIVLIGQGYHGATAAGKYPIVGVVGFGSPELNDKVLYMPIHLAQSLYEAPGKATTYVLSINEGQSVNEIAKSMRHSLCPSYEVMTWEEMMPDIKQHIASDARSMQVIQAILYLLISFGIFGTLLMMMSERRFELGMLVAIGMKKSLLSFLLLLESILTVLLGCIVGIIVSIPIVYFFNKHPIKMTGEAAQVYESFGFEAIFPTSLSSSHFISQGIIVLMIGFLLSLYPLYQIYKMDPVSAMRK